MKRLRLASITLAATLALLCRPTLAQNLSQTAAEIGITPESVVIAGCNPQQTTIILTRLAEAQALRDELHARRLMAGQLVMSLSTLAQQLANASQDQQILDQYQAANQQLQLVKSQIQQIRVTLFQTAMQGLPADTVQAIHVYRAAAVVSVPAAMRVRERTKRQWKAIAHAIRAEKRAQRLDRPLAAGPAQLLANVRQDPAVTQAQFKLDTNLANIKVIFDAQ